LAMRGQYGEREFNGDTIYALQWPSIVPKLRTSIHYMAITCRTRWKRWEIRTCSHSVARVIKRKTTLCKRHIEKRWNKWSYGYVCINSLLFITIWLFSHVLKILSLSVCFWNRKTLPPTSLWTRLWYHW
jgi:hypothetical protein